MSKYDIGLFQNAYRILDSNYTWSESMKYSYNIKYMVLSNLLVLYRVNRV